MFILLSLLLAVHFPYLSPLPPSLSTSLSCSFFPLSPLPPSLPPSPVHSSLPPSSPSLPLLFILPSLIPQLKKLRPKMPPTSYFLFCKEKRSAMQKKFDKLKGSDITVKLSERWKAMSEIEKVCYKCVCVGELVELEVTINEMEKWKHHCCFSNNYFMGEGKGRDTTVCMHAAYSNFFLLVCQKEVWPL